MHAEVPAYERLQAETATATGTDARRLLEHGTRTGETARRVLAQSLAILVGLDASRHMLDRASRRRAVSSASSTVPAILMETACAAALIVALLLDANLEREGKDNHALALLETAQLLHARLAQLLEVWRTVEQS